jgi:copper chaperone
MYQFNVPDMTCGHCAGTITRALKDEDAQAKVDVSLAEHRVRVDTRLSEAAARQCIIEAGYTAEAV